MPRTNALASLLLAGLAIVATLAFLPGGEDPARVRVPTVLETTALPPASALLEAQGIPVRVAPAVLAFGGPLRPGHASEPVPLSVTNLGPAPLLVRPEAAPMVDAGSGLALPAEAITFSASARGPALAVDEPLPALLPGETATFWVTLDVPSGSTMYVPAGAYAGSISLLLQEVRP